MTNAYILHSFDVRSETTDHKHFRSMLAEQLIEQYMSDMIIIKIKPDIFFV